MNVSLSCVGLRPVMRPVSVQYVHLFGVSFSLHFRALNSPSQHYMCIQLLGMISIQERGFVNLRYTIRAMHSRWWSVRNRTLLICNIYSLDSACEFAAGNHRRMMILTSSLYLLLNKSQHLLTNAYLLKIKDSHRTKTFAFRLLPCLPASYRCRIIIIVSHLQLTTTLLSSGIECRRRRVPVPCALGPNRTRCNFSQFSIQLPPIS